MNGVGGKMKLIVFFLSFIFCFSALASLNETHASRQENNLSLSTVWMTQSSLHELEAVDYQLSSNVSLIPSYKINERLTLTALFGFDMPHTYARDFVASNSKISLGHKALTLSNDIKWLPKVGLILPTNENDRLKNTFLAGMTIEPSVLGTALVGKQKFDLTYRPRLAKNFHAFDRNASYGANTEYSLSQLFALSYGLAKGIQLGMDFNYNMNWTYQGAFKSFFVMGQSISFVMADQVNVSLGHSNSGNALSPSGRGTEIRVFDKHNSTVYGQLSWKL